MSYKLLQLKILSMKLKSLDFFKSWQKTRKIENQIETFHLLFLKN